MQKMTGKKLDFSITLNGQIEAVKARIFNGSNGGTFVQLDGVREVVGKGADAKST